MRSEGAIEEGFWEAAGGHTGRVTVGETHAETWGRAAAAVAVVGAAAAAVAVAECPPLLHAKSTAPA